MSAKCSITHQCSHASQLMLPSQTSQPQCSTRMNVDLKRPIIYISQHTAHAGCCLRECQPSNTMASCSVSASAFATGCNRCCSAWWLSCRIDADRRCNVVTSSRRTRPPGQRQLPRGVYAYTTVAHSSHSNGDNNLPRHQRRTFATQLKSKWHTAAHQQGCVVEQHLRLGTR